MIEVVNICFYTLHSFFHQLTLSERKLQPGLNAGYKIYKFYNEIYYFIKKSFYSMVKEIIINSTSTQTRVAITEDGNLVDFFVDYPENRRMVGDIYLGRVARVLPGIRAAFIDIGMKHDGIPSFF